MPSFTHNELELWYEQEGDGDDLVLIAGLADAGASWAGQVAQLSESFRVTTFDNRGVGRSPLPAGDFSISDMADDALRLLDHLGIDKAHVVGSSMGGAIAQELVLRAPERVDRLVLHGTWARTDRYFTEVVNGWQILADGSATMRDFLLAANVWFVAPWVYNTGVFDEWLADADEDPYPQTVDAFCRTAEALKTHDAWDRLPDLTAATLVTVGSLDICTPRRYAQELVERIPSSRLHVFEGAGHMPYLEEPERFNRVVRAFLTGPGLP